MSCKKNISRGCCFDQSQDTGLPTVTSVPGSHKLEVFDWMSALPNPLLREQIVEVQFKNTRKGFFANDTNMNLKKGDIVVVESSPGVDVGTVSLGGDLVWRQMKRMGFVPTGCDFKRVLRFPTTFDIEKWQDAIAMEHSTMIRSRVMSANLGLNMKIGDVEYQADKLKAIFYYIADQRVDFRELIKVLAEQFRVRVEMKQIGARQEAGRIGGIGGCGRELCCSTWQNNFSSVSINAARVQEISPNPQKLAGQCGKLKCCLNYEMDVYLDARQNMPRVNAPLESIDGLYHLVKTDVLQGLMYFSPDPHSQAIMIPLKTDKVRQIMAQNRKGQKVESIMAMSVQPEVKVEPAFENVVGQDSLTRFDRAPRPANNNNNNGGNGGNRGGGNRNRRDNRPPRPQQPKKKE